MRENSLREKEVSVTDAVWTMRGRRLVRIQLDVMCDVFRENWVLDFQLFFVIDAECPCLCPVT